MKRHILSTLAYLVATLLVQGTSHFALLRDHYAAIGYMQADPIFVLGTASMLIQGAVLSLGYSRSRFAERGIPGAVMCAWLFGAFLASYIALAEAAKYQVPSIASWIGVELAVAAVQYTVIGMLLGLVHRVPAGMGTGAGRQGSRAAS